MVRLALALAFGGLVAAALPAPGVFVALGCGIAAIGWGWLGYARREAPGGARLAAAAAMALGAMALVLGAIRVLVTVVAIDRIDRMLG